LGSYNQPLIWIAGGVDKGNDYNLIREEVKKKVKTLICLGKDNDKLKKAFGDIVPTVMETQSVKELVRMALDAARKGDVVLLSPACASFDLFKNYEDRGNQFRDAVSELKKELEG
jgi:UDP-N-acetylmuramoylalanine--D-glutamate ligase